MTDGPDEKQLDDKKPDETGVDTPVEPVQTKLGHRLFRFLGRAFGYWSLRGSGRAWFLTLMVLVFVAAQLGAQVFWNQWNRWFFDALALRDASAVWANFALLPIIVIANVTSITGLLVSRLSLQIRWREWLTRNILGWWIADQRYYRLPFVAEEQSVPEYRISEDVRLAIDPLVEYGIGLLSAFVTAATFATILWQVGGSANVTVFGTEIVIPAYMALAAIVYAIIVTCLAMIAGRPLIPRVGIKNEAEAQFRAEMTRLRENAESIALIRGDDDERESVIRGYSQVVSAWFAIVRQNALISLVLTTNTALFPVIPLMLTAPKYLSGELTLGGVMQVAAAFMAVQGALIWFVDNLLSGANWLASVARVDELTEALEEIDIGSSMDNINEIQMGPSTDGAIHLTELATAHRNGLVMIASSNVVINQGEKVLISGESGTGKSTLIRAIAGLWPWGSGTILLPPESSIAFVPQRPYLPLGTLRNAICYSYTGPDLPEGFVEDAMKRCGLKYLLQDLDREGRWDQELSGGERQRVAFARLLVQKPLIIVMDEATSALDEDSQASLLSLIRDELPQSTWLSVGHRPSLDGFHDRKITLIRRTAGAELRSAPIGGPLTRRMQQWRDDFFGNIRER